MILEKSGAGMFPGAPGLRSPRQGRGRHGARHRLGDQLLFARREHVHGAVVLRGNLSLARRRVQCRIARHVPGEPRQEQRWMAFLEAHPEASDSIEILDDLATALAEYPQPGGAVDDILRNPVLERARRHRLTN